MHVGICRPSSDVSKSERGKPHMARHDFGGQGKHNAAAVRIAEARAGRAAKPARDTRRLCRTDGAAPQAAQARGSAHSYFAAKRKVREWVTYYPNNM